MTRYSLAEAQAKLPELIDRVRRGEGVVLTEGGAAVAEIKPANDAAARSPRPIDIAWLEQRLVGHADPNEDAGALLSRMRDEEAARF
ncbi:MAG: type II toxin-antitoxin system Phd/YefM family antitoxin [Alphaproteobacteria bacterium]|nr:type II toxin-antitoxin system Phd/YefM family antitoxin [Alphaproteobacteria bacterium]